MAVATAQNPDAFDLRVLTQDCAGQVGGKLDPATKIPTAGTIYDCNPTGRVKRPYIPPNQAGPSAIVIWNSINVSHPMHNWKFAGPASFLPPYDDFLFATTNDYGISMAELDLRIVETPRLVTASLNSTLYGYISATAYLLNTPKHFTIASTYPDATSTAEIYWNDRHPIVQTIKQTTNQTRLQNAAAAWNALSPTEKADWNARAKRLGMSGYNLFIKEWMEDNPIED